MFLPGLDLNSDRSFCHPAGNLSAGGSDAHRETGLCSVDGTFAAHDLSSKCGALPWSSQSSALQLLGSISVDGLCATDVPRESARYRSLSSCAGFQALPLGDSIDRSAQHSGQRQRNPRLAYLLRLRPESDSHGTAASMSTNPLESSSAKPSTHWMPPPSICVCRCFLGRRFGRPKQRSSCIPCSTCEAISLRLFGSAELPVPVTDTHHGLSAPWGVRSCAVFRVVSQQWSFAAPPLAGPP